MRHPHFSWMMRDPARLLALGFGSGLLRPAPGTWGSLAGWLLWAGLIHPLALPDAVMAVFLLAAFVLGCWACGRAGRDLGVADHGSIVWDEMVALWLVLWLSPSSWAGQLAAFLLFRVFDILKPPPIRFFDRRLKNGFGVMWDDVLAALYALLVIFVLSRAAWLG